ncbi:MAG: Co2+/Mg2+ efflux protein ApaG [Gammaproteobacteria bacterium]|nr:Co2+/Mg2+ efflux protein ApaG [Gammaproteobacteria bacterium]MCP4089574.1 Co2+/Mg2+ efflux protein ApaG [Gammaproteobacteria bacterium]MCP4278091.1 Co2+/Mg2+ efflux protein ApaG [Gammaproteobacteria bacterium]MCP4832465.1 Co2+/Mg2+ efflux protein ApaG [Gammaproteobacteria bacterium]MCP4930157.1 Co2+/Mg2+ efflux protein ApaG [Gammaproteobacteria bacterium]
MSTDETSLGVCIQIEVQSLYLAHQSKPEENHFVFSYTISISNTGDTAAKLLTRNWLITDADGNKQEVHGDGVVGEQPEIQPGEKHVYSSGAVIETAVGTMEGRYGMVTPTGNHFDAAIPVFRLAVPGVLN